MERICSVVVWALPLTEGTGLFQGSSESHLPECDHSCIYLRGTGNPSLSSIGNWIHFTWNANVNPLFFLLFCVCGPQIVKIPYCEDCLFQLHGMTGWARWRQLPQTLKATTPHLDHPGILIGINWIKGTPSPTFTRDIDQEQG